MEKLETEKPRMMFECECSEINKVNHWSECEDPCFYCEQQKKYELAEEHMIELCKDIANAGYNVGVEVSEEIDMMFDILETIKAKINGRI